MSKLCFFFFSSRRRHTRSKRDWSSDVCSSDLVISKAWLGTGEEATTVGTVHALERGRNVVAPMIRNAAACCELGLPVSDMLRAYLGSADSPARGRDLHVGAWPQGVLQPISHVGDMVAVTSGIALAFKIRQEPRVALTWVGDGATKTAAAHAGTNGAAAQERS